MQGDRTDPERIIAALRELLDKYHPGYLVHGHVHLRYDASLERVREYNGTTLVNAFERYVLEIPDRPVPTRYLNQLRWKTKHKELCNDWDDLMGVNITKR